MNNSIETIWKEGFLNEKSLIAPRINDLYNQKSRHLVDKVNRMFRINLFVIILTAILFPIVYYVIGFPEQGIAGSILLLFTAWYHKRQMSGIKALDQGTTSLDYLKSFNHWLKDALGRSEKVAKFSYPLYFLIALSVIWAALNKQGEFILKMHQKYPNLIYIGDVPLLALIAVFAIVMLMIFYSGKIYKLDLRLMYGNVFCKLEETIAEMEKLKAA